MGRKGRGQGRQGWWLVGGEAAGGEGAGAGGLGWTTGVIPPGVLHCAACTTRPRAPTRDVNGNGPFLSKWHDHSG